MILLTDKFTAPNKVERFHYWKTQVLVDTFEVTMLLYHYHVLSVLIRHFKRVKFLETFDFPQAMYGIRGKSKTLENPEMQVTR